MTLRVRPDGGNFIVDDSTGQVVGIKQADGTEHFFPFVTAQPGSYPSGVAAGVDLQAYDADLAQLASFGIGALSGMIYGLTLANGTDATNDIDVAAGKCIDSTNAVLMSLSALTKQLDAGWAPGTDAGMRNSAAAIANDTYHIFAVCKAGGADPDIYALGHTEGDTAAAALTALNLETGGEDYLYARRIGSIIRASAAIVAFTQLGDEFLLDTVAADAIDNDPGTSEVLKALTVPIGVQVLALLTVGLQDESPAGAVNLNISSPDVTDAATALNNNGFIRTSVAAAAVLSQSYAQIRTDTSGQVRYRLDASNADVYVRIVTRGWYDARGRLG